MSFILCSVSVAACFYNPTGSESLATEAVTDPVATTTGSMCTNSAEGPPDCDTAASTMNVNVTTETEDMTFTAAETSGNIETAGTFTTGPTTEVITATGPETDGPTSTGDELQCDGSVADNPNCGGEAPYCIDNTCVGCDKLGDLKCSDVEVDRPTCATDLGLCVECLSHGDCTSSEEPACDEATATCVPCDSHDQCPATACNLETGQCFPPDNVLYVDNSPGPPIECSDSKADWGTMPSEPLCTLQNALSRLTEGVEWTVKIKAGMKPQNGVTEMPIGNYTVAIVHYGDTVPSLVTSFTDPSLTVNEGNTVFMNRVGIYNMLAVSDPLIACAGGAMGARVWFERQRIFGGRTAIRAYNCQVHVRRSTITGNALGGIDGAGINSSLAKLWVENSYLTDNNGMKFGAIRASGSASIDILYSTIALNKAPVAPIECIDNWKGTLTVRNSVLANPGALFGGGCGTVEPVTSLVLPETDKAGLGNVFSGYSDGVYQARVGGDLEDVAVWHSGDPAVDHDENLRPFNDGAEDYAGADRPIL